MDQKLECTSNTPESSLPGEATASPPQEETIMAISEETVMASLEAVALKDTADSFWDPPPLTIFTSRPITRLAFQQALKDEVHSVTKRKCAVL